MNEFSTKEIFDNQIQNIWNDERFKEIDLLNEVMLFKKVILKILYYLWA